MNYVAAHLLCSLKEEDAFWLLVAVSQSLVQEYHSRPTTTQTVFVAILGTTGFVSVDIVDDIC